MSNILFELDRLKTILTNKGLSMPEVDMAVHHASTEIRDAFLYHGNDAMEQAVASGVEKSSSDFINDLYLNEVNMELTTYSGNMDFSTPPYPNLANLLRGGKPIKDGSGIYKVIPVGATSNRPKISSNIYEAQKAIMAERYEAANAVSRSIKPAGSKGAGKEFRTATSKQSANAQWVIPAKEADFSSDIKDINTQLNQTMDQVVANIINSYIEGL